MEESMLRQIIGLLATSYDETPSLTYRPYNQAFEVYSVVETEVKSGLTISSSYFSMIGFLLVGARLVAGLITSDHRF